MIHFLLNDREIKTGLPPGMLLLDFIRYHLNLVGTKIGCREGDCGACTVLIGSISRGRLQYRSVTCCLMALGNAAGKHIVTIEGINGKGLNPVQQAICDESASQCGFCTPGIVMSLTGFCLNSNTAFANPVAAVDGNICRCTGYKSIERAAAHIALLMQEKNGQDTMGWLTGHSFLPLYFNDVEQRLKLLVSDAENAKPTSTKAGSSYVSGGTDLYVQQPEALEHADLNLMFDRTACKGVTQEGNRCIIGASATVSDLVESGIFQDHFPRMAQFTKLVSSTQIRNMATIAGNFINASPIGDFTIFFLALGARVVLSNGEAQRELSLNQLYKGYKMLNKQPDEYIETIWFDLPGKNTLFHFEKVSKREHLDIASVNTAMSITVEDGTICASGLSAGGVGPIPMFLAETARHMHGKRLTPELVHEVIQCAQTEISPISDARGTARYKRLLLGQLIKAHFITLFPMLRLERLA